MQIQSNCVSIHISYEVTPINNMTRSTSIHFTLLAYVPEQTCLPYCTYKSPSMSTVVYMRPNSTAHPSKITTK